LNTPQLQDFQPEPSLFHGFSPHRVLAPRPGIGAFLQLKITPKQGLNKHSQKKSVTARFVLCTALRMSVLTNSFARVL
jgi:hypothetical protein